MATDTTLSDSEGGKALVIDITLPPVGDRVMFVYDMPGLVPNRHHFGDDFEMPELRR